MGDPKRSRKKFEKPRHPWQKARLEEEAKLKERYGLKNKRELWKVKSILTNFKKQAKLLIARRDPQADKEERQLLDKLIKLSLLNQNSRLEDVLELNVENILNRRLQSIVFKKEFVLKIKQARQFIVHGHITVNGKKVTVPSYLVKLDEEDKINFNMNSSLSNPENLERIKTKQEESIVKKEAVIEAA